MAASTRMEKHFSPERRSNNFRNAMAKQTNEQTEEWRETLKRGVHRIIRAFRHFGNLFRQLYKYLKTVNKSQNSYRPANCCLSFDLYFHYYTRTLARCDFTQLCGCFSTRSSNSALATELIKYCLHYCQIKSIKIHEFLLCKKRSM